MTATLRDHFNHVVKKFVYDLDTPLTPENPEAAIETMILYDTPVFAIGYDAEGNSHNLFVISTDRPVYRIRRANAGPYSYLGVDANPIVTVALFV